MDPNLITFFEKNGLTGALVGLLFWIIKYYVGKDIKSIRDAQTSMQAKHERLETSYEGLEREIAGVKQDHFYTLKQIDQSLQLLRETLVDNSKREDLYREKMDKFRGWVYRKLGNGHEEEE
jgi:tRNA(Ile)-lysidine synthase TilS/MesJ